MLKSDFNYKLTDDYRKSKLSIKDICCKNSKRIGTELTIKQFLKVVELEIKHQESILKAKFPSENIEL